MINIPSYTICLEFNTEVKQCNLHVLTSFSADLSPGGNLSALFLPGILQLAVCGDVTPVQKTDRDPRHQLRHHEILLPPRIWSVG